MISCGPVIKTITNWFPKMGPDIVAEIGQGFNDDLVIFIPALTGMIRRKILLLK
jgi:hypothetical protein